MLIGRRHIRDMDTWTVNLPHGFDHIYDDVQLPLAREKQQGTSCNDLIDDSMDIPSGTSVTNYKFGDLSRPSSSAPN